MTASSKVTNTLTSPNNSTKSGQAEDRSVTRMVADLSSTLESAIDEINAVNSETKLLSLNARIESARAGANGAAFGVVAAEMQNLSDKTQQIASVMASQTRDKTSELMSLIESTVRGTRMSDLALVNIDLVDRNLYERTCDVRWWATDGSLVTALSDPSSLNLQFASKRLGIILSAYTVYFDLVLCDTQGKIVANGRPDLYDVVGRDQSTAAWFKNAIATRSGDDYGFQSAHNSPLVLDQPVLIYSAAVRRDGEQNGQVIGALGILFNWNGLAGPIMQNIPVSPNEVDSTHGFLFNREGEILASSRNDAVGTPLELNGLDRVFKQNKGFYITRFMDKDMCVGHAQAPGFETYCTGWYSAILQEIDSSASRVQQRR